MMRDTGEYSIIAMITLATDEKRKMLLSCVLKGTKFDAFLQLQGLRGIH